MSGWPYGPAECPRCVFVHPIDPPTYGEADYEIVAFCLHPRIAMELFTLKQRTPTEMAPCPCFRPSRQDKRKGER